MCAAVLERLGPPPLRADSDKGDRKDTGCPVDHGRHKASLPGVTVAHRDCQSDRARNPREEDCRSSHRAGDGHAVTIRRGSPV